MASFKIPCGRYPYNQWDMLLVNGFIVKMFFTVYSSQRIIITRIQKGFENIISDFGRSDSLHTSYLLSLHIIKKYILCEFFVIWHQKSVSPLLLVVKVRGAGMTGVSIISKI